MRSTSTSPSTTTSSGPNGKRPRGRWSWRNIGPLTQGERQAFYFSGIAVLAAIAAFLITLPNVRGLQQTAPGNAIQIYDKSDQLIVTIDGDEEREFVPLKSVPKVAQQAIIAAEDHDFYEHHGLSWKGISRAFVTNVSRGHVVEGGSTLTQQLAKNLFFDSADRSIVRKAREAVLALEIEHSYTKDQIMEMYMNQVYFGRQAYGLERAARRYFAKGASQLSLPEAAFLMGLVKAPSYLGEPAHVKDAIERQHVVLDEMLEMGFVTKAQADAAKHAHLAFNRSNSRITKYPYYMSAVQAFLAKELDPKVLEKGGLRVFTNLDPVAQRLAEQTVARRIRAAGGGLNQAALASVLVEDGSVVALVGGAGDYWKHQWNSAIGGHTLGSSFKPFVYLTGFMQGKITPDTIVDDEPISIPQGPGLPNWEPQNFDSQYYGPITIREAIALSRNVCAVRVGMASGLGNVLNTARAAGLKDAQLVSTNAEFLGAGSASPLEMATAYSTFARGGTYLQPKLVRRVESRDGYSREFQYFPQKVFPDYPVRQLVSCMESVVKEGTATGARLADRPVAGKTGTTDAAKDLWFVGFTPHMATAVWGGNDQHRSLGRLTGGVALTGIWKAYNQGYYRAHPTPPGSFYTEEKGNDNILNQILQNPGDVLKSEEQKEQDREKELNGKSEEQEEILAAPRREEGDAQEQEQQQQQQQGQGQEPMGPPEDNGPHMMPLPGAPMPGHVRRPMAPSPNDPFGFPPAWFGRPEEPEQPEPGPQPAPDRGVHVYPLPDNGPSEPAPHAVPRPEPRPEPRPMERQPVEPQPGEPQPAPDFRRQAPPATMPPPAPDRDQGENEQE